MSYAPTLSAALALSGVVLLGLSFDEPDPGFAPADGTPGLAVYAHAVSARDAMAPKSAPTVVEIDEVIDEYCVRCHSERRLTGNLNLEDFDVTQPHESWATAEKVIAKLRANLMPPPGTRRPDRETLVALATSLEGTVDEWAADNPDPGAREFQRLNQAEYARAVDNLLGLTVDPAEFLPPDQRSANFDNLSDAQLLSPTLVTAYMNAAAGVSRMALGDPDVSPGQTIYRTSQQVGQRERVEGAPMGSRGGMSRVHNFLADGEYVFRVGFAHSLTGAVFARTHLREKVEVSIDGERVALLEMDHWLTEGDDVGLYMDTQPIKVAAGPHRVSAVFIKAAEGPVDDLLSPHDLTLADRHVGDAGFGVELLPHLTTLQLTGPFNVTGVSDNEIRSRILTCRPQSAADERPCAQEILSGLMDRAFRGTADEADLDGLMDVYDEAAAEQDFEGGVRVGLQAILANPKFIFRLEEPAVRVERAGVYPISDVALASRLSFFLCDLPPDQELLDLAEAGRLNDDREIERQVRRMIADPRAEALGTRFASQWFRLHDLDRAVPDQFWFPDFNERLRDAMRRETELFFVSLVQEDRPYFDLLEADYTFVNEQLARHYRMSGVVGDEMRKVHVEDPDRRGLLGHASILTATSFANRTSVVIRGKWILEVVMNTPPPPPPPSVPSLDEVQPPEPGTILTSKLRQEMHRANAACAACHALMDPIGLPLESFDAIGRARTLERRDYLGNEAIPLETDGELWDGSESASPVELREALMRYPETMTRAFASNLLTYALGRRMEHYDQPTIRSVTERAEQNDYRMSAFFVGVAQSDAFRSMKAAALTDDAERN